ncbi:hypothetical protein [Pseudomonas sp. PLMAX]|uniref:hypothetical protein n=1 Tax=Pseudomonas sp. PLMAX TaxID=2201998 RepID=UPI0038BA2EAB
MSAVTTNNFMIVKKPGDGSIHSLKEILNDLPGETAVLELNHLDGSLVDRLESVSKIQGTPVNLVFDLTSVENLSQWAIPLVSIMHSNVVGGNELPEGSLMVCIVRDDEELKRSVAFDALSARCLCVATKEDPESFRNLARAIKFVREDGEHKPLRDGPSGTEPSM